MSDENSLFADIRGIIEDLEKQIVDKRAEIAQLTESHSNSKILMNEISETLADYKAKHKETVEYLQKDKIMLEREEQKLSDEIGILVSQKGDLKKDNITLAKQNEEFKKYEIGAWKVLEAKDSELQERERNIQEKESLKPGAKTFLPPINA